MTTSPTAPAQLTDEQLIEKVAVYVMQWEVLPHPSGWGSGVIAQEANGYVHTRWNPIADWNDTAGVVRHMRSHWGLRYSIRLLAGGKTAVEFFRTGTVAGRCVHRDERRAVCLASLQAVSSSNDTNLLSPPEA